MDLEDRIHRIPESGCWVWMGELNRNGYGTVRVHGKRKMVHRLTYEAVLGPIPDGLKLDHLCRVRCCANPHHQEPVTVQENTRRGHAKLFSKTY